MSSAEASGSSQRISQIFRGDVQVTVVDNGQNHYEINGSATFFQGIFVSTCGCSDPSAVPHYNIPIASAAMRASVDSFRTAISQFSNIPEITICSCAQCLAYAEQFSRDSIYPESARHSTVWTTEFMEAVFGSMESEDSIEASDDDSTGSTPQMAERPNDDKHWSGDSGQAKNQHTNDDTKLEDEDGSDQTGSQGSYVCYVYRRKPAVFEPLLDGTGPNRPENEHISENELLVTQLIRLMRDATPSLGRKIINYWFHSSRPSPGSIYRRFLLEVGRGRPLWEPIKAYDDSLPSSNRDCIRIGAIGTIGIDGVFQLVQSYDDETEHWESRMRRDETTYGAGYAFRSRSYTVQGDIFWSKVDPPYGGILFLRAPLYSKDAVDEVRNTIRICALQRSSSMVQERSNAYYITGYDSTKSCIMAVHGSLHKIGFVFKRTAGPRNEGARTVAWPSSGVESRDSSIVLSVVGAETVDHSFLQQRSVFLRGYRVKSRKGTIPRSNKAGSTSLDREMDLKLLDGSVKLVAEWENRTNAQLVIHMDSEGTIVPESPRRLRGGADVVGAVYSRYNDAALGEEDVFDPSDIINNFKLYVYEEASVVITHDDEWTQLLRTEDEVMTSEILIDRWIEAVVLGRIEPELTVGINYLYDGQVHTHVLTESFRQRGVTFPEDLLDCSSGEESA